MSALSNIRLTYQKDKGYKKYIGSRTWWLGKDEHFAKQLALWIIDKWEQIRASGGNQWSDLDIAEIYRWKNGGDDNDPAHFMEKHYNVTTLGRGRKHRMYTGISQKQGNEPACQPVAPSTSKKEPALETGLRDFENEIQSNPQLSDAHKTTTAKRLQRLRASMNVKSAISKIGHDEITAIVRYWLNRPKSKKTGSKISVTTVKTMVITARQFFYWLANTGKWTPPAGLKKLFSVNLRALMTSQERKQQAVGVQTFAVDDLKKLYAAANERTRLFMLLGLNCGFAQSEISSLTNWEIKLHTDNPRIERHRRKTEVFGAWPLWEETIALLKSQMKNTPKNKNDLALATNNGKSLVGYGGEKKRRTDAVGQSWQKLLKKVSGVQQLPFRFLRKTGADMIRKIAGKDISEAYLAHAETGIAKFYTNADIERVAQAVNKLRMELDPIF